ncbi:anthranilate synthase component II [Thalassoglobus polymorphus]|uniref:Aminodeoxychorismate synthase component 2 n=1 Tax=Thalassoglobus polymorphus TaxID=2527994 RepID=A0A517QMN6_9PLAN|nr:aminodeoxychorismate/anthranilate synthase component II [Thalassoglobus polymorphus]QDT32865.1 Aminodeoxychorismate synthase component 2 [Thalassoglobus polymorphus]
MNPKLLLIDNYDSFVFNLARYLEELGMETTVVRNDAINLAEVRQLAPAGIILSPGPCTPAESGISQRVVEEFHQSIPILGVCLGHQAIAAAFGGNIVRASEPVHGRTSMIQHDETGLFADCPNPLQVGRYHSLIIEEKSLPAELRVTARTPDRTIMAIQHLKFPLFGVQFHPESILTTSGHQILQNFLELTGLTVSSILSEGELSSADQQESTHDFYQQEIAPDAWRPL